jgi:type VI protein secretion system component Hcp
MAIYALIQGLSAGSDLSAPFGSDWFRVNSLSWGARQPAAPENAGHGPAAGIPEDILVSKAPDALSSSLVNRAITGAALGVVLIAITEPGGNRCVSGFKLDGAYISSWNMTAESDGAAQERLMIGYRKIAQVMLVAGQLQLTTWDRSISMPWNDAARSFYIDPRLGVRIR